MIYWPWPYITEDAFLLDVSEGTAEARRRYMHDLNRQISYTVYVTTYCRVDCHYLQVICKVS
jgi:hypothetical protein